MNKNNMNKKFLILVFMILFSLGVSALDISDYPFMFVHGDIFDPIYIVGEEAPSTDVIIATIFSTNIVKYPEYSVKIGTSKIDSEIDDVKKLNAIVIGNPCVNSVAADLEGNPDFCFEGLEGGRGYVKLFSHNGKWQLLITGVSAEDRKKMAEYLTDNYIGNLKTKTFSINTGSGSKTPDRPVLQNNSIQQEISIKESTPEIVVFEDKKEIVNDKKIIENKEITKSVEELDVDKKKEENVGEVKETKEEKGFFNKIFSGIASFFKYIFS